jgi:hypothetical protein
MALFIQSARVKGIETVINELKWEALRQCRRKKDSFKCHLGGLNEPQNNHEGNRRVLQPVNDFSGRFESFRWLGIFKTVSLLKILDDLISVPPFEIAVSKQTILLFKIIRKGKERETLTHFISLTEAMLKMDERYVKDVLLHG